MNDDRQRLGYAIGTGLVPSICVLVVIGLTTGSWPGGVAAAIIVLAAFALIFWYRAGRPPKRRR